MIYRDRPVRNALYGNPRWYPELDAMLRRRGRVVGRFPSPTYGMRIVPYRETRAWEITVWSIEAAP